MCYFYISFDVTDVEKAHEEQAERGERVVGTGGDMASSSRRWRDLCQEFTENTTLHGLRYITQKSQYSFRRWGGTINGKVLLGFIWVYAFECIHLVISVELEKICIQTIHEWTKYFKFVDFIICKQMGNRHREVILTMGLCLWRHHAILPMEHERALIFTFLGWHL